MKFTFEKKLILAFVIICIGITIAGVSTFNKNKSTIDTNKWVMHTHEVLYTSQQLLLSNLDIVSYTKEYLVQYDSLFLTPLNRSKNAAISQLNKLKELTADNSLEQKRIEELDMLENKQIMLSDRNVQQRAGNDFVTGVEMCSVFQEINQIEGIRNIIETMQNTENELMISREKDYIKSIRAFNVSMFIFYSCMFLLLNITFFKIRYNIKLRKKAEENLHKSLLEVSEFKNLLENQSMAISKSNAIAEFDLKGNILNANENFLQLFGYKAADLKGKHHSILLKEEQLNSKSYTEFWEHLNDGKFHKGEFERQRKDGKTIIIQGSYNPIYNQEGQLIKVLKIVTEITR